MIQNFDNFLFWEKTTKDTIDFKMIYVDMVDDILAGLLLSQLIYWHLPDKNGLDKMRIEINGKQWIAKSDTEWYNEIRLTRRQVQRCRIILLDKEIIETIITKFRGSPVIHYRILKENFLKELNKRLVKNKQEIDNVQWTAPGGAMDCTRRCNGLHQAVQSSIQRVRTESTNRDKVQNSNVDLAIKRYSYENIKDILAVHKNTIKEGNIQAEKNALELLKKAIIQEPALGMFVGISQAIRLQRPKLYKKMPSLTTAWNKKVKDCMTKLVDAEVDPIKYTEFFFDKMNGRQISFSWPYFVADSFIIDFTGAMSEDKLLPDTVDEYYTKMEALQKKRNN